MRTLVLVLGLLHSVTALAAEEINFNLTDAKHFAKGEMLSVERSPVESEKMELREVYDLSQSNVNWSKGYTTLFIGTRKESIGRPEYQEAIIRHILNVSRDFSSYGLMGYIAYIDQDFEIAWQNWESKASSERAFLSASGQDIVKDATSFMDSAFFQEVKSAKK